MSWFPSDQFVRLEIEQFSTLDSKKATMQFKTQDAAAIAQLVTRISGLPSQGDKMKSPSRDTVKTSLRFYPEGEKDSSLIEIYDVAFKTPSTGFNVEISEAEKKLVQDIRSLLAPGLKKKLLKVVGLSVEVPEGKVTFVGNIYKKNDEPGMPTIGPTNEDHFEVADKKGATEIIKIYSGQVPPQPKAVKVGKNTYTINTFKSSTGESLYDSYFEITK